VEAGGRVVVLDDFENGLANWEGDAKIELGNGPDKASKVLVWHCTDVNTTLNYRPAATIPDPAKYTRITLDIRAWDADGLKGPGIGNLSYVVFGGLPWQLPNIPPNWGLGDYRPVFGDTWRRLSYYTRYNVAQSVRLPARRSQAIGVQINFVCIPLRSSASSGEPIPTTNRHIV
jgi:hypothetical protein